MSRDKRVDQKIPLVKKIKEALANQQHSLSKVSDQKIQGYKMRYKKALKITNDTNNKVKYCQIFGTTRPFFRTTK